MLSSSGTVDFGEMLCKVGETVGAECVYLQVIPPEDRVLERALRLLGGRDLVIWGRGGDSSPALPVLSPADVLVGLSGDGASAEAIPSSDAFEAWLNRAELEVDAVPLLSGQGRLYGYLGIAYARPIREGRSEDYRILTVLGDILANFFERHFAEQELQQSEERWRKLVAGHPEPIIVTVRGEIIYINSSGAEVLGASSSEALVGYPIVDFVSAEHFDRVAPHLLVPSGEEGRPLQHELVRLDGEWRIVESHASQITYEGREAVLVVLRDITERKHSENRYRNFVETISEGIWRADLTRPVEATAMTGVQVEHIRSHAVLTETNEVMARILGLEPPLVGQSILALFDDPGVLEEFVSGAHHLRSREISLVRPDGTQRYLVVNAVGTVERGRLLHIWGSCIDVTERIEIERRTVALLEKQQQRIGRELHDGVGQLMTGIRMLSDLLYESLTDHAQAQRTAQKVARFAAEASHQIRNIYRGLTPAQIGSEGLASVLEELANNTDELPDVRCRFVYDGHTDVWDADTKLHLYRIAQEATNNALKHARATEIVISFIGENEHVRLQIEDDGIGLGGSRRSTKSLGIDSMYYRANAVRARLEIGSGSDGGTIISCLIPRAASEAAA